MMQFHYFPILAIMLATAHADTFGTGANEFTIEFVTITKGKKADGTHGAVEYDYRMGKHEVSQGMITAYNNAPDGGPDITFFDLRKNGGNGANKAAGGVSWNEAARFVNWLNTSRGYSEAYKFTTGGANDNIALWTPGEAGYDAANPFRNLNARYFLPSWDEWYRAAFYDPKADKGAGAYWNYATGSNSAPMAVASGTASGTAVYSQKGPADIDKAGGLSPFGTMGQSGNVMEWGESAFIAPNKSADEFRWMSGGSWYQSAANITSKGRSGTAPQREFYYMGFRVAATPLEVIAVE